MAKMGGRGAVRTPMDPKALGQPGRGPRTGAVSGIGSAGKLHKASIPATPAGSGVSGRSSSIKGGAPRVSTSAVKHGRVPTDPAC